MPTILQDSLPPAPWADHEPQPPRTGPPDADTARMARHAEVRPGALEAA